jgi:hypothetical protein
MVEFARNVLQVSIKRIDTLLVELYVEGECLGSYR